MAFTHPDDKICGEVKNVVENLMDQLKKQNAVAEHVVDVELKDTFLGGSVNVTLPNSGSAFTASFGTVIEIVGSPTQAT